VSQGIDESFITGRLQASAREFNVGFVVSHGHAGRGTESTWNNQHGFEIGNFGNDIHDIEVERHGDSPFSSVEFAITAEHVFGVAVEPTLLFKGLLQTLARTVNANLGGSE